MAELPSGIDMEIESLRLDFHVYANLAERRGSPWKSSLRDSVSNWGFSKLTSSSLLHLSHFHSHSHSHPLTLTQTRALSLSQPHLHFHFPHKSFISHTKFLLTKLSHFLSISNTASHIRTRAHTHTTTPASKSRA